MSVVVTVAYGTIILYLTTTKPSYN